MNSKLWIRKAVSSCLMIAMLVTYSMVALANTGRATGEIVVNSGSAVTVNGEAAKSGRTIFTSSVVSTQENTSVVINLGTAGEIELAPNTTLTVSFDDRSASLDLTSGNVTVLKSVNAVNVTVSGTNYSLNAGESASATAGKSTDDYRDSSGKCIDADKDGKEECGNAGGSWWLWALVMGGAAGAIIYGASQGGNDINLGGGTTVVSPNR